MSRSAQRNLYDSGTGILRNWGLLREIGRRGFVARKYGIFTADTSSKPEKRIKYLTV